jgi:hypothetical protein
MNYASMNRTTRMIAPLLLCLLSSSLAAAPSDSLRYRPGVRNSPGVNRLNEQQLETVLRHLREKTGFLELEFDVDGFLTLGDRTNFSGGSATARNLLAAAVEMKHAVELEAASERAVVSFARIANAVTFQNRMTGQRIDSCSIQIDFRDFLQLRGDRQAITAFDPGFVLLHELGHAALGLHDTFDNSPGDCEAMVNRIRRELNLPERQTYIAHIYQVAATHSTGITRHAELIFVKNGPKPQRFYLSWEANQVGPVVNLQALAPAKAGKPVAASLVGQ